MGNCLSSKEPSHIVDSEFGNGLHAQKEDERKKSVAKKSPVPKTSSPRSLPSTPSSVVPAAAHKNAVKPTSETATTTESAKKEISSPTEPKPQPTKEPEKEKETVKAVSAIVVPPVVVDNAASDKPAPAEKKEAQSASSGKPTSVVAQEKPTAVAPKCNVPNDASAVEATKEPQSATPNVTATVAEISKEKVVPPASTEPTSMPTEEKPKGTSPSPEAEVVKPVESSKASCDMNSNGGTGNKGPRAEDFVVEASDPNFKLKRKLLKKLRQIEVLEDKGRDNLDAEQIVKLESKQEILDELQALP